MEDIKFEELLNSFLPEEIKTGNKIKGTILRKDSDYGYLNINDKLEGRIRVAEIEDLEVGSEVYVQVVKKDETFIIVSKKILEVNEFFKSINKGDQLKGKVVEKIKGGYKVDLGLITAFLPFKTSMLTASYVPKGEEFLFEVSEVIRKNNKIVLSRENIVRKQEEEYINSIKLGDVVKGRISNKLEYGLIVDLGAISALLHFSELCWDKEVTLKAFNVDDVIEAKVIEIDAENKKVKLSLKQLKENPWIEFKKKFSIGQNLDTVIKEILSFGVLVDLEGREELIHISELYYKKVNSIKKEFHVGDILFCEVIGIDDEKEKIVLSPKTVFEKIWNEIEHIYILNDVIKTTITNIKDFGIFTRTCENIEIFIPRSEFSWDKSFKPNFKVGEALDVKIIEIKKEEKNIVGSIKQLGTSPYEIASAKFNKNTEYEVEVTDVIEKGVLVKLTDDFKGLIPEREFAEGEKLNKGDKVRVVVFDKNPSKYSILLSVKKLKELEEKKELDELMKIYGANN